MVGRAPKWGRIPVIVEQVASLYSVETCYITHIVHSITRRSDTQESDKMMDSDDDDIYPTNDPVNAQQGIKTEPDAEEEGEEADEDDSDVSRLRRGSDGY